MNIDDVPSNPPHTAINEKEEKTLEYELRDAAIIDMVKKFKDHPYVQRAIINQSSTINIRRAKDPINTLQQFELLSAKDEKELFGYIEKGIVLYKSGINLDNLSETEMQTVLDLVASRQTIYITNLRLAIHYSNRYKYLQSGAMTFDDIVEESIIGLGEAISRFNISMGNKFSTFAVNYIKKQITRSIGNQSRQIRLPMHRHQKFLKIRQCVKGLESSLDREPTDDEIVSYIEENVNEKMTSDEYHALMKDGKTDLISLNKKISPSDSDSQELMDFIKDNADLNSDIDTMINEESRQGEINQIINRSGINDRTKMIIGLYFGLNPEAIGNITVETSNGTQITYEQAFLVMKTWKKSTLERISSLLGITRERVRQIKLSGLIRIQNHALKQ